MASWTSPSEDPGWRPALSGLWWVFIPGQLVRQQRKARQAGVNGLTVHRKVFLSFVAALILIGAVVETLSIGSQLTRRPRPGGVFAIVVVVYGVFALTAPRLIERPLDCTDEARLAGAYRTRFFLRVAFSESVALLGFVGFMVTGRGWLYPLGAAFTAIGFCWLAPTARNLAKDQEALVAAGCGRSLVSALAVLPPSSQTRRRR
jgi:hypothetical protein